jgi:hypothetical protein
MGEDGAMWNGTDRGELKCLEKNIIKLGCQMDE